MGIYIYRVTARTVKLADGRKAHVAQFAYKPWNNWDGEKINRKLHFRTGCVASENIKLKSDLLITFDEHENAGRLWHNPRGLKVFYDDTTFGTDQMPKLARVARTAPHRNVWQETEDANDV